jgi:hypothetical protein
MIAAVIAVYLFARHRQNAAGRARPIHVLDINDVADKPQNKDAGDM